jgi:copper chaperone
VSGSLNRKIVTMDSRTTLYVENLKCGGCENTVRKIIEGIQGVSVVVVDSENGSIEFDQEDGQKITEKAIQFLTKAGYTPRGESDFKAKAISYVSCMRGKFLNPDVP